MSPRGTPYRRAHDVLGLAWVVIVTAAALAPALRPGTSLGPFDLLTRIGLTRQGLGHVHSQFPADQVLYFVPLTDVAWHQVHAGHLPLWNPDNLLGVPLAFSWQSAVFSLPVLVSYLAPVHLAYTVIVLVKLLVAGSGAYVLCRVLGLRPLAAAFGATTFELSGPMLHYSGWAMTGVTAWAGWILAAALLIVRGGHRVRDTVLLAVFVAAAVYGGHPESVVVLALSLAVFLTVFLAVRAGRGRGEILRPVLSVAAGALCGLGLSAPLVLPGVQLTTVSGRAAATGAAGYGLNHLADLLVPVQGTDFRVPPPYMGVLAVVLAVVAVRVGWRRRAEVVALVATAAVALVLTYQSPLYVWLQGLPGIKTITWNRDVMLLGLALAVLAAFGLEAMLRSEDRVTALRWATGALVVVAVAVALAGLAVAAGVYHVAPGQGPTFVWPGIDLVVGAAVVIALRETGAHRVRRLVPVGAGAGALLVAQAVFLCATGASFWSVADGYFSPTPAVARLQHDVGSALVGTGTCRPRPFSPPYSTEVGIRPNANAGYGVTEFAAYEPNLPASYYRSWAAVSGQDTAPALRRVGLFCPQITTAAQARTYGVSYLLVAKGTRRPPGTVRVDTVGGETLVRVPGATRATLIVPGAVGVVGPGHATTRTVQLGPAAWRVRTDTPAPGVLRLRITAAPGWHATVDGRPLALSTWSDGAMLQASVPAGRHVVDVDYGPTLFTVGIAVALVVALALVLACVAAAWLSRDVRRAARVRTKPVETRRGLSEPEEPLHGPSHVHEVQEQAQEDEQQSGETQQLAGAAEAGEREGPSGRGRGGRTGAR